MKLDDYMPDSDSNMDEPQQTGMPVWGWVLIVVCVGVVVAVIVVVVLRKRKKAKALAALDEDGDEDIWVGSVFRREIFYAAKAVPR